MFKFYFKAYQKYSRKIKFMYKLAIFLLEKYPYHSGIIINDKKIADLSLLGSKIIDLKKFNFEDYESSFFKLYIKNNEKVFSFINSPITISKSIIDKERNDRGWFKNKYSADYILKIRNIRSINIKDMNCIEWIIYALEIGGYEIPKNILTASKFLEWSNNNLEKINIKI
ncbi:MAG: hypothetical protein CMG00_00970 [Candidatus Marinimicrobia bacterium]|nr:hypothetical protein [Candidatus Neomarinimicrobiota bacterium]